MKKILPSILLIILCSVARAADPAPQPSPSPTRITLDDVVSKVSTENYTVYTNALRVYQARQAIQVARGNLLPKLNLWRIAGVAVETALGNFVSPMGLVGDIAPFLVPSNWFRSQESEILFLAEQEGYRALWANELMTAKALYVHLLLDQSLLEHINASAKELLDLLILVQTREALGGVPQGASRDIEVRLLALQEDKRSLEVMLAEEEATLSYMLAYPADTTVQLTPISMPAFDTLEPLKYDDFEYRAVDSAPELRQYNHFISAADYIKQEVMYSFLGISSLSRGVAGGVFDGIPIQDGLGFGTPASMRIVKAQKEILTTQRKGIEETVKRHLKLLIGNYNLDLENYANLKKRVELTKAANDQLYERLNLGQNVDMIELIEASRNHIQADTSFFAVQFRFLTNEDRLARLIFYGDYTKPPATIESLKEQKR